jgi:hypothetical protein
VEAAQVVEAPAVQWYLRVARERNKSGRQQVQSVQMIISVARKNAMRRFAIARIDLMIPVKVSEGLIRAQSRRLGAAAIKNQQVVGLMGSAR